MNNYSSSLFSTNQHFSIYYFKKIGGILFQNSYNAEVEPWVIILL